MEDFFSDGRRAAREYLRQQTNQCRNPWGYQEFAPPAVRVNWGLAVALMLCAGAWVLVAVLLGWVL